jgi:hypothetical protein
MPGTHLPPRSHRLPRFSTPFMSARDRAHVDPVRALIGDRVADASIYRREDDAQL